MCTNLTDFFIDAFRDVAGVKPVTAPQTRCNSTLHNVSAQLYNCSFISASLHFILGHELGGISALQHSDDT